MVNSLILYSDVTEVYDQLCAFCSAHGFRVRETKEKYFSITANKRSILFWRSLQMKCKVVAVEKKKVEVTVMIYKYGKRKPALENKYHVALDHFLSGAR